MSCKTILVHVDETRRAQERIRLAARLALREEAHLIGAAMTGVSRFLFQNAMVEQNDPSLAHHLAQLRTRARGALETFDAIVRELGVPSSEQRLVDDEAAGGIALQARYADLVVIGQDDPDEPIPSLPPDFQEYVALNAARPVLVVPYVGDFGKPVDRVLIAWDGSIEAARAATGALPLLRRASRVEVVVFNPDRRRGVHGDQPGADVGLYLARHGVRVDVSVQQTDTDIGNALLSMAADRDADLIVMGAYGHSRFREILLGGVTRTVLGGMTVPVLMAH